LTFEIGVAFHCTFYFAFTQLFVANVALRTAHIGTALTSIVIAIWLWRMAVSMLITTDALPIFAIRRRFRAIRIVFTSQINPLTDTTLGVAYLIFFAPCLFTA
jgi:hypothetical protein